jgi:uncharacterized membrane protein
MGEVKESIEVNVPVSTAYNQWTQFEDFPKFMENVESVTQLDDTHLRWIADVRGTREEWKAEITHQQPDKVVAWRALEGKENSGRVDFEPLEGNRTRVEVTLTWEPEGLVEAAADKIGVSDRAIKVDLENYKQLIESRGVETGAWRGEVVEGKRVD